MLALEYEEPGFSLHISDGAATRPEHRFHVEHFRRQLGERVFVLVREESAPQ